MNPSRASRARPSTQEAHTREQRASTELVHRIRKLRWIGLTEEAERLQAELSENVASDCVLATPRDTD
jgi:hypothetical protein